MTGHFIRRNGRELHSDGRWFLCPLNLNCFAKSTEIKVEYGMMFFLNSLRKRGKIFFYKAHHLVKLKSQIIITEANYFVST